MIVYPTPIKSVLWHGIIKSGKEYYFGTNSLFDKGEEITFHFEESYENIPEKVKQNRLDRYYLEYTQSFSLIKRDVDSKIQVYAIKYGPINYFGKREFIYHMCLNENELSNEKIIIKKDGNQSGPVKDYSELFKRIKGI
jgi:hypothetical protein